MARQEQEYWVLAHPVLLFLPLKPSASSHRFDQDDQDEDDLEECDRKKNDFEKWSLSLGSTSIAQLVELMLELSAAQDELRQLHPMNDKLQKNLDNAKRNLEDEMLKRIDLQNQLR